MRQCKLLTELLKHHFDTLANRYLLFNFRIELLINEVRHDAQTFGRGGHAPLLVELDDHHGIRRNGPKTGLDGMHDNFVSVDRAFAAYLLPGPVQRHTPGAAGAWWIPHEMAC